MEDWLVDETSDLFKDDQLPHYPADPIDWKYLIEETMDSKDYDGLLDDLSPTQAGNHIHEWLQDEFSDIPGLKWERWVQNGEETGKYDAFDGDFVYEFKTKFDHRLEGDSLPMEDDIDQADTYLEGLGADYGVLVYIGRGEFDVEEYLISP